MRKPGNKVAVIGAGNVGASCAFSLMHSGLVSDLLLIDQNAERAVGEAMDLSHGLPFVPAVDIQAGDTSDLSDSDLVILTAGVGQKPGETRLDLLNRNAAIYREMIPEVVKRCPGAILLVVANPVDVLTYVTIRESGLPVGRVIGSGTVLDSARLRYELSRHTQVDARNIHAYVLGEHGDTELPAWSLASIAGQSMQEFCRNCDRCPGQMDEQVRGELFSRVKHAAYEIIERKGATYYAVALAVRRICEAILRDEHAILTVSSLLTGQFGLDEVCLSLPSIVGAEGIERTLPIELSEQEQRAIIHSGRTLREALASIGY